MAIMAPSVTVYSRDKARAAINRAMILDALRDLIMADYCQLAAEFERVMPPAEFEAACLALGKAGLIENDGKCLHYVDTWGN